MTSEQWSLAYKVRDCMNEAISNYYKGNRWLYRTLCMEALFERELALDEYNEYVAQLKDKK